MAFFYNNKKKTQFFYGFTVIEERNKGSRLVIKKIHEEQKFKIYKNELQELCLRCLNHFKYPQSFFVAATTNFRSFHSLVDNEFLITNLDIRRIFELSPRVRYQLQVLASTDQCLIE